MKVESNPISLNSNKIPISKYNSYTGKKNPNSVLTKNDNNNKASIPEPNSDLDKKILSLIFFKKYKPIKLLGAGTFSVVYEGINIKDNTKVALKLEEKKLNKSLLKNEALNIFSLQGFGIIKFISFGHSKDYNILVEPLLGDSLYALYLTLKKKFTLKDICLIAIQTLERIEFIHSKGYLHGDIKPENFVVGKDDQRIIYIIDFGLSKKYRSDRTGNHIQFCITKKMNGTARYASTNSLRGVEISRRDDLECLSYMIIYFLMKKLPWQGVKANTVQNRYKKIYYMKKKFIHDENFKKLPEEIQEFYKDIKKLKFEEKPNYIKLREYFHILLKKNGLNCDNNFSWIDQENLNSNKEWVNLNERKSNSQKRLMDKLLKNKKQNKNEEVKNNNIKIIKSSNKFKFNNEYGYANGYTNPYNKDIKSVNEAIDIDVGDFSDNEDEKQKNDGLGGLDNLIMETKLRKYNSDIKNIKKKELIYKNKNIDSVEKIDNIEENKNDKYYNVEIKNYISFNQNIKIENKMNKTNKENIEVKDNFRRCNINKNYLINEFKNKNKIRENRILINKENINNENIKQNNMNINVNNNKKDINQIKRSKSGEKCFIQ